MDSCKNALLTALFKENILIIPVFIVLIIPVFDEFLRCSLENIKGIRALKEIVHSKIKCHSKSCSCLFINLFISTKHRRNRDLSIYLLGHTMKVNGVKCCLSTVFGWIIHLKVEFEQIKSNKIMNANHQNVPYQCARSCTITAHMGLLV